MSKELHSEDIFTSKYYAHEVKVCKEVLRRLDSAIRMAKKSSEKKKNKRLERVQELAGYETLDEAQDAYGYGYISAEEFEAIKQRFEEYDNSFKENSLERSVEEDALQDLAEIRARKEKDLQWFEQEFNKAKEREKKNGQKK